MKHRGEMTVVLVRAVLEVQAALFSIGVVLGLKPWSRGCSMRVALPICVLGPSSAVLASLQEFNWKLGGVCHSRSFDRAGPCGK